MSHPTLSLRIFLFVVCGLLAVPARAEPSITVFAAASLSDAVTSAADAYRRKTGAGLRISFASSSTLARQIEAGAGADIFMSANRMWMDYLEQRNLIEPGTRRAPIGNALVLIAPSERAPEPVADIAAIDIPARLGENGWLALGDPAHVPAGIYARQALEKLGQWTAVEHRLARCDNVRSALALVGRGEAALGIVYRTDALVTDTVRTIAVFPPETHDPIAFPFAITAGHGSDAVRALFDFLTGPQGLEIFEQFGFVGR